MGASEREGAGVQTAKRMTAGKRALLVAVLTACQLLLLGASLMAQKRVYATVTPLVNEEETLSFDINLDISDNISPTVVITPDGTRGYVPYAGSGILVAFSFSDGQVLNRIELGGRPSFANLLRDGRTLAVVSVLDNRIFLVDTETDQVVATHTFSGAQFGFGSLLTISPDGITGYISSTGTGEVIKFNVFDGTEIGRLGSLLAPAQITLTPDGSKLIVVDTEPNRLVFADSVTLSQTATLQSGSFFTNFTLFNKPVLTSDGVVGIIASRDNNGILSRDTAFVFNVETAEILNTLVIGGQPGSTILTPDGKFWVILCEFEIIVVPTSDADAFRSLALVQGEAIGSANVAITPDSRFAFYASSRRDFVYQHDIINDAVVGQVDVALIDDLLAESTAQPSSIAVAPDGVTLAVVNFTANTIDLMTDVFFVDTAKYLQSVNDFTGVTLINLGSSVATVQISGLTDFGQRPTVTVENEDGMQEFEIDGTNPREFTIHPNQQISQTTAEIFNWDDSVDDDGAPVLRLGWLQVASSVPGIVGHVSIGKTDLSSLDGVPLFKGSSFDWIAPEIVRREGSFAEMNVLNRQFNRIEYDVVRRLPDGTFNEDEIPPATTMFGTSRQALRFDDLFPDSSEEPVDVTDGYLRYTTPGGLWFSQYLDTGAALGALNGIDMRAAADRSRVYSPQFASLPGFRTILNVINGSDQEADITVTLHRPDGTQLSQPLSRIVPPNGQIKGDLGSLFSGSPQVEGAAGWLEVVSTQGSLVGNVTFTNEQKTFLTIFELAGTPLARTLFPVVAQDSVYQTGVALFNPGDRPATVTIEVWNANNSIVASATISLAARERVALYLNELVPSLGSTLEGHFRVLSDLPLISFSIINDLPFNFVTALPPIEIP